MTQFLTGKDMSAAIKNVLGGDSVRCIVAFWGGGAEALFDQAFGNRPRIICDVTLGGTSPNALRALGAPKNDQLRHIPSLHAKVYVSDRGAVVGSANASQNGVGLDGPPSLIEAGILLESTDSAFGQIEAWFEKQWKESKKVDDSAIELAAERFRPGRTAGSQSARPGSLIDIIAADPDRFSNVSIVVVGTATPPDLCAEIRGAVREQHPEAGDTIDGLENGGIFSGWEPQDLNRWRRTFIELWMPKNRLSVFGRKVAYFHDATGAVTSIRDWPSIRHVVGGKLPTAAEIAETDGEMVKRLLDTCGERLYSANELAAEVEKLSRRA